MQVSLSLLEEIGACEDARSWFYSEFGLRSVWVVDALEKCKEDMWIVWFAAAMEQKLHQSGYFQSLAINMIAEMVEERYGIEVKLAMGGNNVNVLHELDEAVSKLPPGELLAYSIAQSLDFLMDVRPSDEDTPPSAVYATSIYNALVYPHRFKDASKIMFNFAVEWLMRDEQ